MNVSLNCVVCNQLIVYEDDGAKTGEEEEKAKCLPFQLELQLLYKLLKVNGTTTIKDSFYFGQAVGKLSLFSRAPCCEECGVVFGEMVRLQQAIEEMQMSLIEHVDKLKNSLLTSVPPDYQEDPLKIHGNQDALELIREQLLSSVRDTASSVHPVQHVIRNLASSNTKRKRRPRPRYPLVPAEVLPKKPKEYLPCSVILKRIPQPSLQTSQQTDCLSNPPIKTDFGKDNLEDDEEYLPSPPPPETGNDDDDDSDYPWESELEQEDIPIKQEPKNQSPPPIKIPSRKRGTLFTKFAIISPNTLLYQTTFIKVSHGYSQLICQEPDCPTPNFSSHIPLSWNNLLEKISVHIDSTHEKAYSYIRPCPLCNIQFKGKQLRSHLIGRYGVHHADKVICEICLKPVRNVSDNYREHHWRHKNEEDKRNCLQGPPSKIKNKSHKSAPQNISEVATVAVPPKPKPRLIIPKFWAISPDTLLYQTTLVKVEQGYSQLICQEAECPSPIFSLSDIPLNWKQLFDQMANHINSTHCTVDNLDDFLICPLCQIGMQRKYLKAHLVGRRGVHQIDQAPCDICLKTLRDKGTNYRCHQWRHKNEQEKQNCLEGIPSRFRQEVITKKRGRPRKVNKDQKVFSCKQCGKGFNGRAKLGYHEQLHLPKEMRKHYKCSQCPQSYLDQVSVRAHVERVHNRDLLRWRVCQYCGKKFNYRAGEHFRRHLRSHRNERPYVCEICGKAFLDTTTLRKHRIHVHEKKDERSYQCDFTR